ncbi:MAG: PAS domain S-box protein, partial [Candidatus Sulfotelmatobacter sp.]
LNGTRRCMQSHAAPLHQPDGACIQLAVMRDVTDRMLAGRATALLAAIVDSSDDAIVSKNLDGVITSWNKGAERLFGYTAAEATGKHITLIIPEDRREEEVGILRKLRNGQRIDHFETVRKHKDGTLLDISVTISPVKDESGRIIGASKVARDIGHRKRAEADLRRSEEQLRKLSETLDAEVRARTRELEDRNTEISLQAEQLRELSWRVARAQEEERRHVARELHDSAGQTLTVLSINAAQLVDEAEGSAPDLAKRGRELQALIQQLHREVRTASYLLHPPLLDEAGLASALNWYVQGLTERSGLSITLDIPNNFGRLSGDMELVIFRLVQECLTNIHRHSGSKTAAIRVLNDGENVRVQVTDEGIGIPPELLAKVQTGGSGVGIRGMQERLRQFRGAMEIVSNGSGTSVIARIPVEKELDQPSTKSPVIWEFRNSG